MKIAFLVNQFPKLSETFILNQATGLLDRGHHVDIFAKRFGDEIVIHPDVEKYNLLDRTYYHRIPSKKIERTLTGLNIFIKGFWRNPRVTLRLLNFFAYGKDALSLKILYRIGPFLRNYDIIHCHFGPTGNFGATLKGQGIQGKLVTTFHGFDIRLGLEKGGHFYHNLFAVGDCFISISNFNRNHLINFGLDERKIVDLPVGINLAKFPYKWNGEDSGIESIIRVVTVARLVEVKGLHYGLKAIQKVLQNRPNLDLTYTIIGGGPLREELEKLSRELGLSEVVHIAGPRQQNDIIKILGQSHIFLLPSIAEVLPVSLMEAHAVGLPVIATDVGDIRRIVLDGKSGFVVKPRNVDALADKLRFLFEHPYKWPEMGITGRTHVAKNYDINKLNDRLVEIYFRLLDVNGTEKNLWQTDWSKKW